MMHNLSDIGKQNAEFAERFLRYEGIRVVSQDLGGQNGRRLQYWPFSGRARQSYITSMNTIEPTNEPACGSSGEVELF